VDIWVTGLNEISSLVGRGSHAFSIWTHAKSKGYMEDGVSGAYKNNSRIKSVRAHSVVSNN